MTIYKYINIPALICVLGLFFVSGDADAEESDFTIVPGVSYGYKNATFDITNIEFFPEFISLDTSLTLVSDKFYISANYDSSIKDDLQVLGTTAISFSREDYAVAAGYGVWKQVSLFAGYKSGKTEVITINQFGTDPNEENKFEEDGPFFGLSVSHNLSDISTLGMSIAYAKLDGSVTTSGGKAEGDTTGLSVGLNLSGSLSETVDYQVGLKAIRYEFYHDTPPASEDVSSDLDFDILTIGVKRYFR